MPHRSIIQLHYSCTIESITAWYGNCSASDREALQRVMRTALYITGAKLPDIQDLLYILGGVRGKPKKWSKTTVTLVIDCSLCYCTANGTGVQSLGPKGSLINSFFPQDIRLLNDPDNLNLPLPPLFLHCCYSLFIIYA
jgi:hypothetical protein